ncbi:putative tartrate dehydrogenase/decarboxylase TtuC' [Maioricimonas rarisocia]|uniref:3-isopropylmalate dehydrogenase n=1 Tax=Maioricimonas rarisocia TaxID=2528026 RepID=A0A517ZAL3_9PLAN|nr:isocitrate/isopropylmalate dehydrogenase family protein [Maioricimonas rarisocia]QDU39545.1 putative tartrate dehydrogenase/decarboxylase TtuC' [Maioricimonas rarisocia]
MSAYRIVLLPGDGIGPETMSATRIVLDQVTARFPELRLDLQSHEAGAAHYRRTGEALPDHVLADCLAADAVLLAAIGLPDVRLPDGTEVQPQMMVGLRRAMQLHSAVRPVKLYPGVPCPLKDFGPGIDLVIVRENLEGMFASFGGGSVVGDQVATDTIVITREGTSKVVDVAFQVARRRSGRPADGKRLVTCVDKANVFRSMAFFRKVFRDVAKSFPEIEHDAVYVDAMSLLLVQRPQDFDVLVMENQFGDILSDLGAALVGGLGLAPSAELGSDHGLFQPSHGTAPQIAGRNMANPIATILSAAMMLEWLGDRHNDPICTKAAATIESAVAALLEQGATLTPDLGGRASTTDVARAISELVAR